MGLGPRETHHLSPHAWYGGLREAMGFARPQPILRLAINLKTAKTVEMIVPEKPCGVDHFTPAALRIASVSASQTMSSSLKRWRTRRMAAAPSGVPTTKG